MKKIVSLLVILGVLLSFCSCSDIQDNDKTPKEKLCDYVLTNGANYQGVYTVIELDGNNSFAISCNQENELIFTYSSEHNGQETFVAMKYFENSVTQTVTYEYEIKEYICEARGTIYTNNVSTDNCQVFAVSYNDNFPYTMSDKVEELVDETFGLSVACLFSQINLYLTKYTDIKMSDLGFTNW